mgnify:FL=1
MSSQLGEFCTVCECYGGHSFTCKYTSQQETQKQQNLTQPLDIRRIADALESLATSIQTLVRINGLGELGFIERPGGPLAGGGALAEPGVSDTLSGPLSDQPRAT